MSPVYDQLREKAPTARRMMIDATIQWRAVQSCMVMLTPNPQLARFGAKACTISLAWFTWSAVMVLATSSR